MSELGILPALSASLPGDNRVYLHHRRREIRMHGAVEGSEG